MHYHPHVIIIFIYYIHLVFLKYGNTNTPTLYYHGWYKQWRDMCSMFHTLGMYMSEESNYSVSEGNQCVNLHQPYACCSPGISLFLDCGCFMGIMYAYWPRQVMAACLFGHLCTSTLFFHEKCCDLHWCKYKFTLYFFFYTDTIQLLVLKMM